MALNYAKFAEDGWTILYCARCQVVVARMTLEELRDYCHANETAICFECDGTSEADDYPSQLVMAKEESWFLSLEGKGFECEWVYDQEEVERVGIRFTPLSSSTYLNKPGFGIGPEGGLNERS